MLRRYEEYPRPTRNCGGWGTRGEATLMNRRAIPRFETSARNDGNFETGAEEWR